jgi:ribosomal protein S18 acetylase RimI-like enzyme
MKAFGGPADLRWCAFQSPPVCGADGLRFSAHLCQKNEVFKQVWSIYTDSFAAVERRSRREQARVMRHPCYRFSAVMSEGVVVGVMAWWDLPGFCFVEHFAISSAHRSGGLGRRVVELLQAHVACPIVLDVAPFGADHQAARRVAFYQRLGFAYCGQSDLLPAYEGRKAAPSNLMAWGITLDRAGRERVLEIIGYEIYGQPSAMPYPSAV